MDIVDNMEKQRDEPIPWPYRGIPAEFGGGCASVSTERWVGGKWQYCSGVKCKCRKEKK